tara:strand:- start:698 stop:988 length:291 start_codon:yes stop_codon:yes gene_type:complete
MTERTLTVPTVHLNGTGKDDLLNQLYDAYEAVGHALDVMRKAGPNGRDYYPQGTDALRNAQDEHQARATKLHQVQIEVEAIIIAINDGSEAVVMFD